jgi:hypothetical protein
MEPTPSVAADRKPRPDAIGNTALLREPERLILQPKKGSIATSGLYYGGFALLFLFFFFRNATAGRWGMATINVFFILFDGMMFSYTLARRDDRVMFDREKNQLRGRTDDPIASLTAIDRIEVMRTGGSYGVALSINGKQFRPSIPLLTFRNRAEAIWMGEQLSDFVEAPVQIV